MTVEFLGVFNGDEVERLLQNAKAMNMPSEYCEGFPMAVAESRTRGAQMIAVRIGSLEELKIEGVTGMGYMAGDVDGLIPAVRRLRQNHDALAEMRRSCRFKCEGHLTEEGNYQRIMQIYENVFAERSHSSKCRMQ